MPAGALGFGVFNFNCRTFEGRGPDKGQPLVLQVEE